MLFLPHPLERLALGHCTLTTSAKRCPCSARALGKKDGGRVRARVTDRRPPTPATRARSNDRGHNNHDSPEVSH